MTRLAAAFAAGSLATALLTCLPAVSAEPASTRPVIVLELNGRTTGLEILRCHLEEGRLAVRFDGEILVLRPGDALAGDMVRLKEVTPAAAVLVLSSGGAAPATRVVRIAPGPDGAPILREYATDPTVIGAASEIPMRSNPPARPATEASASGDAPR